jgi:hypothetical protein
MKKLFYLLYLIMNKILIIKNYLLIMKLNYKKKILNKIILII